MERISLKTYYADCACGCGCDSSWTSDRPFYGFTICEECLSPIQTCQICEKECHVKNYGGDEVGEGDLICCLDCLEEIERVGRVKTSINNNR